MQVKLPRKINNLLLRDFISINTVTHDIPLYKIQTESIRFCKQKHFPFPFSKEEKSSFIDKLLLSSRIWLHMRLFSFVDALMEALQKRTIVWPEEWKILVLLWLLIAKNWKEITKISKADSRNYILYERWGSFVKMNIFMFFWWGDWWFDFIYRLIGLCKLHTDRMEKTEPYV